MGLFGFSRFQYQRALGPLLGAAVLVSAFVAPILLLGSDEPAIASAEVTVPKKAPKRELRVERRRSVVTRGSFWSGVWEDLVQIVDFDDSGVVGRFDPDAAAHIDHFGIKRSKRSTIQFARAASSGPLETFSDMVQSFNEDYVEPLLDDVSDSIVTGERAASDLYYDVSNEDKRGQFHLSPF